MDDIRLLEVHTVDCKFDFNLDVSSLRNCSRKIQWYVVMERMNGAERRYSREEEMEELHDNLLIFHLLLNIYLC